jgi:hypothetical protein
MCGLRVALKRCRALGCCAQAVGVVVLSPNVGLVMELCVTNLTVLFTQWSQAGSGWIQSSVTGPQVLDVVYLP